MKQGSIYETHDERDLVNSLSRGLSILECFTSEHPRLTQSQIQKLSGVPKATLFRLLRTLTGLNYLKYDTERRQYYLGPRVLSLGFSVLQSIEAREVARPYLQRLAREFNRTVSLLMLDNNQMVYVERIKVPTLRDYNISVGSRIAVYNTASGRAVLAYMNDEKLRMIMDQLKKESSVYLEIGTEDTKLLSLLREVRKQGYATNDEESLKGVRAIAVPIFSSEDPTYAMNVVVPPEEVTIEELRTNYAPRLMEVGREISETLGRRAEDR